MLLAPELLWLNRAFALFTKLLPGLLGYQLVFVARPAPGAEAAPEADQRMREEEEAPSVAAG
jgi:hypothetical protein